MNGVLLGLACFGALAAILASDPSGGPPPPVDPVLVSHPAVPSRDPGSMIITRNTDPATGETTEISVIAFRD